VSAGAGEAGATGEEVGVGDGVNAGASVIVGAAGRGRPKNAATASASTRTMPTSMGQDLRFIGIPPGKRIMNYELRITNCEW